MGGVIVAVRCPKTLNGRLPPLVTSEDAIELLRACLEARPDTEKSLEDYMRKFEYNLRYG